MNNETVVETYKGINILYDENDIKAPYYVKQNVPVIGVLQTAHESIDDAKKYIDAI